MSTPGSATMPVGEMEEYVVAAIAKGLEELVFLEHLECGIRYREATWLSEEDFAAYHREGQRLQQVYARQAPHRDRGGGGLQPQAGAGDSCVP